MAEYESTSTPGEPAQAGPYAEAQDVARWVDRYDRTRKFDEPARRQYAHDRRYARGDTGAEVSTNLLGVFVDILESFLFARNPDVDALPARSSEPPSLDAIRDAVMASGQAEALSAEAAQAAFVEALNAGKDEMAAQQIAQAAAEQAKAQMVHDQYRQLLDRWQAKHRERKAFAATIELVVQSLWRQGRLKHHARRAVRSALSIGIGWLKASWQERTGIDPVSDRQANDLRQMIERAQRLREQMDEASAPDEATVAEYERQLAVIEAQAEEVIARGFAIDLVAAEDLTVSAEAPSVSEYLDSPWIAHRMFLPVDTAAAMLKLSEKDVAQAEKWYPRKPVMRGDDAPGALRDDAIRAEDADAFVSSSGSGTGEHGCDEPHLCIIEIWHREGNVVLTVVRGLRKWGRPPWMPKKTTRFYPFFAIAISPVDGQRHPQSLVSRSYKLQDEYTSVRSAFRMHRKRALPGVLFDATAMTPEEVKKIEGSTQQEYTGLKPTRPGQPIQNAFFPKPYAQVDPALYDTSPILADMERIWGVQEALSQSTQVEKTATEAEIQQSGFQARTGAMRDVIDEALSDLATYTAEVALANMDLADVQEIAGPDAYWPEGLSSDELAALVNVEIRAGSSGKPNVQAERQAWSATMPVIQSSIMQIGQLRGSSPDDIANALEELVRETVNRSGDRLDIERFIPQAGGAGAPMQPPAMPGAGAPMPMPEGERGRSNGPPMQGPPGPTNGATPPAAGVQ